MRKLHAAGSGFYGDEWDAIRAKLVSAVSKGRTSSSSDLTTMEAATLINGIEAKAAEADVR